MVTHVVEEREVGFIGRIRADLSEARRLATLSVGIPPERLVRLEKMATLAEHVERALRLFIKTARLDVAGILGALREDSSN
jgi:hypothetical protein